MKRLILISCFVLSFIFVAFSQDEVLQIFDGKNYTPVLWEKVEGITFDEDTNQLQIHTLEEDVKIGAISGIAIPSAVSIPLIEINTDEFLEEIPDKINYKEGDFLLSGLGEFEDLERRVNIRGRGNTSWTYEKKPYRLKFDKKVSLCGLPSAKSYVLLSNYVDCSLIQNALAFKIGKMLDLPYTNRCVPVDLKLNGIYKGSYLLTNKPGINAGSVDIDEDRSIMWELDVAYDEEYKFRSPLLDLPVMVADPDIDEERFQYWMNDFIEMEEAAVEMKAADLVDMDIAARYVMVYDILLNGELGFPKSVKMYKTEGGKYMFGPIWDFDTAMGKVWNGPSYTTDGIENRVWRNNLLAYIEDDPLYQEAFTKHWILMRDKLSELLEFVDEYASTIRNSAIRNQQLWQSLEDFDTSVSQLKDWLTLRFEALDKLNGNE